MKTLVHASKLSALVVIVIMLQPAHAMSQSIWTDQQVRTGLSLEILKPSFEEGDGLTLITTANYLSGRFAVGKTSMLELELPIAHYGFSSDFGSESETSLGNPYLGLLFSGSSSFVGRFGVRLPLASEEDFSAMLVGIVSDYDRFEAFSPNVVTVAGSFGSRERPSERFEITWGLGPVVLVSTEDVEDQAELFAQYRLQAMYNAKAFSAGAGFTGRALVTESDLDFGQRTIHQLTLVGLAHLSSVHPGLYVRFPLDDNLETLNFTMGINVMFEIGRPSL